MQGSNNKEWLIKSSGEIKGPYTFEEVAEGIASREFILVDEISKKFSRWKYLRDEEVFEKVILEHKNREYSKNELTFTDSSTDTDTLTEDLSKKVVSFGGQRILENINEHHKENQQARESHIRAEAERKKQAEIEVRNYAAEAELKKQSVKESSFKSWIILAAIVIGGALFYVGKKEKTLSYDDIKKLAYDNFNYGNYEDAKFYLEKALAVNSTNEELKFLLSYVSMELEDFVTAQRLTNDLSNNAQDKELKSRALNLTGILHLKNFALVDAKKNFSAALAQDPSLAAVHFNLGIASYLEDKYEEASQSMIQSLNYGGVDGSILLSMVEMTSRGGNDIKNDSLKKQKAQDILTLIERQTKNLYAYRQELKIAAAYLHYWLGDTVSMEKELDESLGFDPQMTPDHLLDVSYYRGFVTWDKIAQWIKKMQESNPKFGSLRTLYGYALFKGSEKLKGKDMVEGLLKSDYSNTSNQITLAYMLMSLKREDDAKATLAPIMHHRDKSLSFILMGRICLVKKDFPCADLNFSEALRIDKESLPAIAGLADTYYQLKDNLRSKEFADRAYRMSPTYKPAMNLVRKLEVKK